MESQFEVAVKKKEEEMSARKVGFQTSSGRSLLGCNGVPTRLFFAYLFQEPDDGIEFLKDSGLLKKEMQCPNCDREMSLTRSAAKVDKYMWTCRKGSPNRCVGTRSLRHGSWFSRTRLRLGEVMLLTYDIIRKVPSESIDIEYGMKGPTRSRWFQLCREVILDHVEGMSEKIGGEGKVVEIDESKFGKRKYQRGRIVSGEWVFGGVERGSGKTFLVAVPDRTADTLIAVIKKWIEPGTTIISDCLAAYNTLKDEGYEHQTVNDSLSFVDERTGAHTNTIKSTWRHVKATLPQYNRLCDYMYYLAEYMFRKKCESEGRDQFTKFMDIVAATDWDVVHDVQ